MDAKTPSRKRNTHARAHTVRETQRQSSGDQHDGSVPFSTSCPSGAMTQSSRRSSTSASSAMCSCTTSSSCYTTEEKGHSKKEGKDHRLLPQKQPPSSKRANLDGLEHAVRVAKAGKKIGQIVRRRRPIHVLKVHSQHLRDSKMRAQNEEKKKRN